VVDTRDAEFIFVPPNEASESAGGGARHQELGMISIWFTQ